MENVHLSNRARRLYVRLILLVTVVATAVRFKNHGKENRLGSRGLTTAPLSTGLGVIHLGKCNGMALKRTLNRVKKGIVKDRGFEMYHMRKPMYALHQDWIALIRDPVDRVLSVFNYEHPKNAPYRKDPMSATLPFQEKLELYDCFDTIDELVTVGLGLKHENQRCSILANQLFARSGKLNGLPHFVYNYDFYYDELLKNSDGTRIFVVRTENMVEDLNRINILMGGVGSPYRRIPRFTHWKPNITHEVLPANSEFVSSEGMHNLCRALCLEIQVYKKLLDKAINLNIAHNKAMKEKLQRKCPEQARLDTCNMPKRIPYVSQTIPILRG